MMDCPISTVYKTYDFFHFSPVHHPVMLGQVDVPEGEDAIQAPHPSVLMSLAKLLDRECWMWIWNDMEWMGCMDVGIFFTCFMDLWTVFEWDCFFSERTNFKDLPHFDVSDGVRRLLLKYFRAL